MASFNFGFDPYEYTNGRWLRADAAQRDARRVKFDFPALCQKAISSALGAKEILECSKVEGNFNRAFIIRLDNGTKVVARVPFSVAGPSRLVTNSEVATMAYIREKTSIPIPQVLDWSDDPSNSVGTEYLIMEHVSGVPLQQQWPDMDGLQRLECIQNLGNLVKEMHNLEFPAYGSIYFNNGLVNHCFYNRKPPNRGPWKTINDFTRGLLDTGISRIPDETPLTRPAFRGTVEEHVALLSEAEAVIQVLSRDPRIEEISSPILLHPDLHKRNIFVDPDEPTKITAIIDWQSTCLDPALLYFNEVPDLCQHPRGIAYDAMDSYKGTHDQTPEEAEKEDTLRKEVAILRATWDFSLEAASPKLHAAQTLEHALIRPFRHCSTTWQHGICGFRSDLINLSQGWADLGLSGSCPYQPTKEELAKHTTQWEDFEAALNLERGLINILSTDEEGFVHADNWDVVKEASKALLEKCEDKSAAVVALFAVDDRAHEAGGVQIQVGVDVFEICAFGQNVRIELLSVSVVSGVIDVESNILVIES
ncbi:hypothetical protein diail_3307, partial [Diaporthe ilicicola]